MPSAFIVGGSGYVGSYVAAALRREGFDVTALVRTRDAEKNNFLVTHEIKLHVGDATDVGSWIDAASRADYLIQAATDPKDAPGTDKKVVDAFIAVAASTRATILYTAGAWIYGGSSPPGRAMEESDPVQPHAFVAWRPAAEKAVLAAGGIVLRLSAVYGGVSKGVGPISYMLKAGIEKWPAFPIYADPAELHWGFVHIEDVAAAYVAVIKAGSLAHGHIFNVNTSNANVATVTKSICKALGHDIEVPQTTAPSSPCIEEIYGQDIRLSTKKLEAVTGWKPKGCSLIRHADVIVAAALAAIKS